jgi:hydroxymethylpyrimidine/phosphomethylpyrimidine kinase
VENARTKRVRGVSLRQRAAVCSVGSTDPTAGAGLFSDAAVFARLGVAATFVVTGVTAQNSGGVAGVHALPPRVITAQLRAVWEQVRPNAVRIGLLPDRASADAIGRFFRSTIDAPPIVLDPVIAATSGHRFAGPREIIALRKLFRIATIATPNALEAAELAGMRIDGIADAERAALALSELGCAVLIKGGHLRAGGRTVVDVLAIAGRVKRFEAMRLRGGMRGTGCVLAAAIAAALAKGDGLETAVRRARAFVRRAIASARPLGRGRAQFDAAGVRTAPV